MFYEDMAQRLEDEGVGVRNVTIFIGSNSNVPAGLGPYIVIAETGGVPSINTQQASPAFRQPTAQILTRSSNYALARSKAEEAYAALCNKYNITIGGVFYASINAMQEPFDLGLDEQKRPRIAFNILAVRRM